MKSLIAMAAFVISATTFAAPKANLRLTSYNAGLAHTFVMYAEERIPHVIEGLKRQDSDVICLQEVWTKKDKKEIIKKLEKAYPHNFSMKIKQTRSERRPTCKVKDLFGEGKFVQCMKDKCGGKEGDEFTQCIINDCGTALENLKNSNRECAQGLMAQVGRSTIASLWSVLNPFVPAGQYAYKGSTGLLILSKKPLKNTKVIDFSEISFLNRRAALVADVEYEGKDHKVVCTHLTANLDGTAPYAGRFDSWSQENIAQVEKLIKETESEKPTYLMGDFNCGFKDEANGLEDEFEESCQKFLTAGYSDPVSSMSPECSYCNSNNLVNEGNDPKEYDNLLIDHIFVKNAQATSTSVVLKEKVQVKVGRDEYVTSHISDHFGVSATVE
jgi:endonuclease/exonuclease/phosphatase family metal-dependent hydrolase